MGGYVSLQENIQKEKKYQIEPESIMSREKTADKTS
jgi:hypothetical protein